MTGLRVIGAGMGRTGTASLKRALETLGFGPCHHMEEVFKHPAEVPTWERAARGEPIDWKTFMAPWGAAVDFPSALYYRELMAAFPDAKVVLSVRDADSWYASMKETIVPAMNAFPTRFVAPMLPYLGGPSRVMGPTRLKAELVDRFSDERAAKAYFERWNEDVKVCVPADRLLVFQAKEGWEPLCRFLGVPVPSVPYPRVNDTAEFKQRTRVVQAISWTVLLSPPLLVAALAARALR